MNEALRAAMISISVDANERPKLDERIATAQQTYLTSAAEKYSQYANVFITTMSANILDAIAKGQVENTYVANVFDYEIPESRTFSDIEKNNCPQSFYDEITKYFVSQNVTCTITPFGPVLDNDIVYNTIVFTWS